MIQEVINKRCQVIYERHYICELLGTLGFSYQKAKFVSDHLNEEARQEWLAETWPQILAQAKKNDAMILFGDEATCAMWGSLGRTWAPKGQQPLIKTSGKRKGCNGQVFLDTKMRILSSRRPLRLARISGLFFWTPFWLVLVQIDRRVRSTICLIVDLFPVSIALQIRQVLGSQELNESVCARRLHQ